MYLDVTVSPVSRFVMFMFMLLQVFIQKNSWSKEKIHVSPPHQVYLMAAPPSAFTGVVFQTHLGLLNGAVAALLFPVLDTYVMPGEVSKAIMAVKVKTLVQIMV